MEPPYSCPACGSQSYHLVKSLGNAGRLAANIAMISVMVAISWFAGDAVGADVVFRLIYRCNDCENYFRISDQRKPNITRCKKCNYDLRGNTSGICPECGRKISARMMGRIRKAEQAGEPSENISL